MHLCPSTGPTSQQKSTVDFITPETVAVIYLGCVIISGHFEHVTVFKHIYFSELNAKGDKVKLS
jgi:hypothetical protein